MNIGGKLRVILPVVLIGLLTPACSSTSLFGGDDKTAEAEAAPVIYKKADDQLGKGNYSNAADKFEEVDKQHPYSTEARQAIVMAAWAYYKAGKHPEAVAAARRYLTLHPGTKEAAMAQEIIASCYYDRITDQAHDQSDTRKALVELETLIRRYPDSRYVEEAKRRVKISRDLLAASEMEVGRFYLKKSNYLAAINRFRTVVTDYQTTAHVEEALMRLTEGYMAMGITGEAQTAAAVLGHNFPESQWYKDAFALLKSGGLEPHEDSGSWISRSWSKVKSASPF
jgi:outer membrane protein assembly factor BamD